MLTFSSSPASSCIPFSTTQDNIYEFDEDFIVHLGSSDDQVRMASPLYSSGIIIDDDKGIIVYCGVSCWSASTICYYIVVVPCSVELQLVVATESVCEGAGPATVCVWLRTDTEREVTATVETSDLSAQSKIM